LNHVETMFEGNRLLMSDAARLPYALTAYGLPHMMGYLPTRSGEAYPNPVSIEELMRRAADLGLAGVECPLPKPGALSPAALRDLLATYGLRYVANYMAVLDADASEWRTVLEAAAQTGATVVRSVLSRILCGDRRKLEGGWNAHMDALAARLNAVLPVAADLGLCIAVENHQDATTEDLLRLHDMVGNSPAYGVTLDAGNPLSVGQDPVEAAGKLAYIIRHVHLKDYTIHFAPEGYRLVRCAAGDGVVDFPAILRIVRANGHNVLPGIEIAAQQTRTIPFLEEGWWACHEPRDVTQLLPALRILWAQGRPVDEPYGSAWERGEGSAAVASEEWDIVTRSVEYFRSLAA
jgi:sugar phosphate isomerase/epimerase